jgi:TPR repeat protein
MKEYKMRFKYLITTALMALAITAQGAVNLTASQQSAKEKGITLYNQYKSSEPELRIAAEAGDAEAQFYLAEELRQKSQYITPEATKWYEAASAQGNLYAMLRLARSQGDLCATMNNCSPGKKTPAEWLKQARELAASKASKGDAEAAYVMYLATAELEWLEKSAESGYALGQWLLATRYKEGDGSFLLPWKRAEAVERWAKESAAGGNPKGMMEYAAILFEKGDSEGFRHWNEQAALVGYATTVYGYGSDLAHEPDTYGFPYDVVKGYALIYLLKELDGGGGMDANVNDKLPKIAKKMTPEQIDEAKKFAKEWKNTHPPLSFYPDKLGY